MKYSDTKNEIFIPNGCEVMEKFLSRNDTASYKLFVFAEMCFLSGGEKKRANIALHDYRQAVLKVIVHTNIFLVYVTAVFRSAWQFFAANTPHPDVFLDLTWWKSGFG